MNYVLIIIVLLICGGAYYEHSTMDQRLADDEKKIADQDAAAAAAQADKLQMTAANDELKAKLAQSEAMVKNLNDVAEKAKQAAVVAAPAMQEVKQAAAAVETAKSNTAQMGQGVVLIKGDDASGTGFLVKTADGAFVITNLHVLANNRNIKIATTNGIPIPILGMKGAQDRDLAMLTIKDGPYTYLPLAKDVSATGKVNDDVMTPGNSQGGDVVLNTTGKLIALGPDRVEFNNPIYHGNSGGPVFHPGSGSVIAVVTEAMQVDVSNDLDKTSFVNRNSAIASSMRYFGLRLDNVPKWEDYDMRRFQNESVFLDQFHDQSERLDSFLNSKGDDTSKALYRTDDRIMKAARTFHDQLSGADTASQIEALRELAFALDTVADSNLADIQNPNNFYTYDQQQAKKEAAYRKALKDEIQRFTSDVSRIGSLPRSN